MTRTDDSIAMDRIAALLDGRVWDPGTLDHIACLIRESGRRIRDVDNVLPSYRISFEDADHEPLDGREACYDELDEVVAAFTDALLSRSSDVGTVALWTRGVDDEWACVASCDLARLARTGE
jgi:hypothetical protein